MFRSLGQTRSVVVSLFAAAGLTASLLAGSGAAAVPDDRIPMSDKIAADLEADFAADGTQDFWVSIAGRADNSAARTIDGWGARGRAVYNGLRSFADESQSVARRTLDQSGADYQPYWIVNAIFVSDGTRALALELAGLSSVESIFGPVSYELPETTAGAEQAKVAAVEWGIANINANDVWDQFGVRGEGITVASIDSGVQFDHPALVEQYRGNKHNGEFDHNYNWYDAAGTSPNEPEDDNGHGTHTMGTMVGDDGGPNQIGVAPRAEWITSNGCCPSNEALLNSMQWMLAPRDLTDAESSARPSQRPHIINNSWGTQQPSNDPFGEDVQQAWADAGIFGMWSNGNSGPNCQTSGSPGSRIVNYSAGAYDINDEIASFSSRGSGQGSEVKPNISAPGVDVRSSVPGNGYENLSGTSMASPHTAGSIALIWSAEPELIGDIGATRDLLDSTARDTADNQCGGDADDNNVYGEGRLDALALVQAAPPGGEHSLIGRVRDRDTGAALVGADVTIEDTSFAATTNDKGRYRFAAVPAGVYRVTASLPPCDSRTKTTVINGEWPPGRSDISADERKNFQLGNCQ